jgi:hypothetical protein
MEMESWKRGIIVDFNSYSAAAKVYTIMTRSNKGCKHSPSPAPELDTSEFDIGSDYEERVSFSVMNYTTQL